MICHQHQCIHESFLKVDDTSLRGSEEKIHLLMGAVLHLQSHCAHLEEVLRANGIVMPDNLPTSLGATNEPAPN